MAHKGFFYITDVPIYKGDRRSVLWESSPKTGAAYSLHLAIKKARELALKETMVEIWTPNSRDIVGTIIKVSPHTAVYYGHKAYSRIMSNGHLVEPTAKEVRIAERILDNW